MRTTQQGMTLDDLLRLIRGAGKQPAERDSFYRSARVRRQRALAMDAPLQPPSA
ncbi:MAG: hypothetical protein U5K74_03915 [Gemmatimonadaceae bacterium]|nr:hypothetical protein [Gemmatimonadaceae bacterium]